MLRSSDSGPQALWWTCAVLLAASATALGSVPSGSPTFSHPLKITNRYAPFQPGGMKVLEGTVGHGSRQVGLVIQDNYLTATRSFQWEGHRVQTRVLQELAYEDGELVEISHNYFAEADDGTVYYFGEVVDIYQDGAIVDHGGSWLVGGPTRTTDPPDTANASDPAVFMPENPERGDVFKPEDVYPFADETDLVTRVGLDLTVAAGEFEDVIQILETSALDPVWEKKWYAPDVGVVMALTRDGEQYQLVASTLP